MICIFYPPSRKSILPKVKSDWGLITKNISALKYYFTVESFETVFQLIKPLFYPNDLKMMCRAQSILLWFFPYNSELCTEKYIGFMQEWITKIDNFPVWTENWIHAFCKISSYHGKKFISKDNHYDST